MVHCHMVLLGTKRAKGAEMLSWPTVHQKKHLKMKTPVSIFSFFKKNWMHYFYNQGENLANSKVVSHMKICMFPKVINRCNGQKTTDTQCLKQCEGSGLISYWQECKLVQRFWKTIWPIYQYFKCSLLDQTIPLQEMNLYIDILTHVYKGTIYKVL